MKKTKGVNMAAKTKSGLSVFLALAMVFSLFPFICGAGAKLPGGVTHRLKQADMALKKVEKVLAPESENLSLKYRVDTANAGIDSAKGFLAEIQKNYSAQLPSPCPEVQAVEKRIADLEKQVQQLQQAGQQKESQARQQQTASQNDSAAWVARLKPYVNPVGRPDHNPEKYLIPSATMEEKEMQKRLMIYAQASTDFTEYQKAALPAGKTEELQKIEEDLARNLKQFKASCGQYAENIRKEFETDLTHAQEFIKAQQSKKGADDKPLPLDKLQLKNMRDKLNYLAVLLKPDDPQLIEDNKKYDELIRQDEEVRKNAIAQTRMTADQYKGSDAEFLRKKAEEIVLKKYPQAKTPRITLISPDWKEERVLEYTDTTNSALRYRVTRSVTAQVASKQGNNVFLYTLDLSKDQRTDNSWGDIYGHIMFTDPILEENITK
jgi:hypothetical protein